MVFRWPLNKVNAFIFFLCSSFRKQQKCAQLLRRALPIEQKRFYNLQMNRTTGIVGYQTLFVFQIFSICKSFICLTVSFSCKTIHLHRRVKKIIIVISILRDCGRCIRIAYRDVCV